MSKTTTPRRADHPDFDDSDREAWAKRAADRTDKSVADEAGVSLKAVWKWRQKWKVEKSGSTRRARGDVATDSEKRDLALECQRIFFGLPPDAVEKLRGALKVVADALEDAELVYRDRMQAVAFLADRGWGKPYQATPPSAVVAMDTVRQFVLGVAEEGIELEPIPEESE